MEAFRSFLESAPKSELHVHLRGAMPREFFADLLRKYRPEDALAQAPPRYLELYQQFDNIRPFLHSRPGLGDRAGELFHYKTFDQFLATYLFTSHFIREIADFRSLIAAVRRRLEQQNVVYAEVTVSLVEYVNQGLALGNLLAALDEAAAEPGVRVQWIADLVRNIGPAETLDLLQKVLDQRPRGLAGITLGGSEHLFPPEPFREAYALARDHGLRLTVHAGEAAGPASVWGAIRALGVDRIGHGVRSIEDPSLVDYLAERQIPLEVCPTSNIVTGVYPSYGAHPVKKFHDAGVALTINTDDPSFFDTTLSEEYLHVQRLGVPEAGIVDMMKNGFRHAFLPQEEIERYLGALDEHWDRFRPAT